MPRVFPIIVCSSVHTFVPSLSLEKICKLNDPIGRGQEAYPFKKKKNILFARGKWIYPVFGQDLIRFGLQLQRPKANMFRG